MLAPYDDMHPIFGNNPTFTTSILSTSSIWAQGTVPKDFGGFDARLPNSIRYDTPSLAGFLGSVLVSLFRENPHTDAYVLSAAGIYDNGPFLGGIGYERNNDVRADGLDDWALSVAAGWDFGVVRLAGVYERLSYQTPTGPLKRTLYGVSATAPLGNGTVYAVWIHGRDGSGGGSRVGQLGSGPGTGANQWEVSYTYPFSRRTIAYLGYARLDSERNAQYTFNINPYFPQFPPPLGMKLNGFVAGLVQYF